MFINEDQRFHLITHDKILKKLSLIAVFWTDFEFAGLSAEKEGLQFSTGSYIS